MKKLRKTMNLNLWILNPKLKVLIFYGIVLLTTHINLVKSSVFSSQKERNKFFIGKNSQQQLDSNEFNSYSDITLRDTYNFKKSFLLNQNFNLNFDRFDYENNVDNMTFVYGSHSTLWILGKNRDRSDVFVSSNNGKSFNLLSNKLTRGYQVDNIFSSQFHHYNVKQVTNICVKFLSGNFSIFFC